MRKSINHPWDPRDRAEIDDLIKKMSGGVGFFENCKEPVSFSNARINKVSRTATTTGLSVYKGDWESGAVLHLLKRTLFGVKQAELESFSQMSLTESIEQVINSSPIPAEPVNDYDTADSPDPEVPFGSSWVNAPYVNEFEGAKIMSLNAWGLNNAINQEATIHEKMILFWHNLLPTQAFGVFVAKASYRYFELLRRNALGNFKTMIKELTLDPCMLLYLNGASNNKYAPDENYARELQELFTIGKGTGSGYTEGDVQAAARLLTGYTLDWYDIFEEGELQSSFVPDLHDTGDKQFSEFYGNRLIEGKSGEAGQEELDEMLDMIFENNETALYICRRLYNFFVYSEIDESVERLVIEPLADILRENNYEMEPVLKVLFASEHFFDEANRGAMIKNPMDHFLGFWRTLGIEHLDQSDARLSYRTFFNAYWGYFNGVGMRVGDPPSVSGWPAYYQAPSFDKSWITTDTITTRAQFIDALIYGWYWVDENNNMGVDLVKFLEQLAKPEDPNKMIDDVVDLLFGISISIESHNYLKSILLTGQSTDVYWTSAWQQYQGNPTDETLRQIVESRLRAMFQAMCQLGEFQLM